MNDSISTVVIVLLLISGPSVAYTDDLEELRSLSALSASQSLKSLVGYSCTATMKYFDSDGREKAYGGFRTRASIRSEHVWLVLEGPDAQSWEAAIVQNGNLGFTVNYPNTASAKMPEYGFGRQYEADNFAGTRVYFPSLTAGSYYFEKSFAWVCDQEAFQAKRVAADDSAEFGKCWEWSIEQGDGLAASSGKVWYRSFADGNAAIAKLIIAFKGGMPISYVNHFSNDPSHPAIIIRREVRTGRGMSVFEIESIEPEHEPVDGFSPDRFGCEAPVNPSRSRLYLLLGAVAAGGAALLLTRRLRNSN